MGRICIVSLWFCLLPTTLQAQSDWFPFSLPWEDSSRTIIDAADLLIDFPGQNPAEVVDSRGFLRVSPEGHFYWEKTGKRARFWGVNFTFNANFPPCPDEPLRTGEFSDKSASDKIARRLAKLGVNVVRFHHMDTQGSPSGIWNPAYYPGDTQHIDAGQLKRFDWLIYQLRQNGIYVNLNLKVGRHFGPGDGVAFANLFQDPLSYFVGVSHFNQRMIDLQREYARQILTHRNPYTGKAYSEDPAVAFVEIANEDSMFGTMLNDQGLNYIPGVSGTLPELYSRELDENWNQWLSKRYNSRDALESAWKSKEAGGDTSNRIRNWTFDNGLTDWYVNQIGNARVQSRVESVSGTDGKALRLEIVSDGTNWHVQLIQSGHAIEKDRAYELSFYAKASVPGEISIDVMQGIDPWSNYGLSKTITLTTEWQKYTGTFRANTTDGKNVRPTFELGAKDNTIWIDQVEFRLNIPKGLEPSESFSTGNVKRPVRSDLGSWTPQRVADLFRFYTEVDETFFLGMHKYLKEQLGIRAPVTGTAPWWGYLGDIAIQSKLDFVDGHYYWDHPWWPPGKAWQPTGWQINNRPWINSIQDFAGLAYLAVEGKPFTLSEFNEVFPNRYALEGPLLVALIANLQDWDAVYMFDYAGSAGDFAAGFTTSFFSQSGNPVKSAQLPICSRIFLGRQSATASGSLELGLNREELSAGYAKGLTSAASFLESKGVNRGSFLKQRVRLNAFDLPAPVPLDHPLPVGNLTSDNGELFWNRENPQSAYVRIRGSAIQGAVGFVKGMSVDLDDWSFKASGSSPDHLAVLLQSRDGNALRETRKMIFTVWTEHQNTGMGWNSAQTSVDNRWGTTPTILRPAQLELTLRFPSARLLKLYPLDEKGNRKEPLSGNFAQNIWTFTIDTGRDRTLWYEIEINAPAAALDFSSPTPGVTQVYTEPGGESWQTGWLEIDNRTGPALRPNALLEYSSRGVLTSIVRMPISVPRSLMRIPVLHDSGVDTALALLNRQTGTNEIQMQLVDAAGNKTGSPKAVLMGAGESSAFFMDQQFDLGSQFEGTLEIRSPLPFHSIALRGITNAAGDFALTPYPPETASGGPLYFAHLAADSSYSSEILLWNPRTAPVSFQLEFRTPEGQLTGAVDQPAQSEYTLQPGQLKRVVLARSSRPFYGYARMTLTSGTALPSNTVVIVRWENESPASEAGVPAAAASSEEVFLLAERPFQRTAVAILNPTATAADIEIEVETLEGKPAPGTAKISLLPGQKKSFFLNQVFADLPTYATGRFRVRSGNEVAILALIGITNQRGEFLISSITGEKVVNSVASGETAVLPRYATGGGYRTSLFLLPEGFSSGPSQGQIRFYDMAGIPYFLLFR